MSLRNIELQIAIPRTSEVGKIQQAHLLRPAIDQTLLAEQINEHTERMRNRSGEVNESSSNFIHDGEPGEHHHTASEHHSDEHPHPEVKPAEHPYKGKNIDLSF
ncbi:hypothetical protein PO903_14220 [Paenibacillus sp. PK4536]|uniref:Uncharacterized protein n=1 Tax=Paenibacillus nuruki TaxID=1886670 RepID=A0A1E3L4W8_9BACL|nr:MULTISPECIES: hypothetical protein [Paenibacillus]ODP28641.1 hypothetical protein PTI45_01936 [Paenibacillus nuruki]TKJ91575.1 hypothetical protein PaeCFBP13512_09565 [Paenibacillus sp. CFBP13512]WIM37806.1 hypothetical protein PO903_14220 [Paenibacillus sp. PK4536]CAJ1315546.1 Flg-hook domain-containing protein [Paenibacillus nuruki]